MKKLLLGILLTFPLIIYSQDEFHKNSTKPQYYVNNIKVTQENMIYGIDLDDIEGIKVVKEGDGKMMIELKPEIELIKIDKIEGVEITNSTLLIIDKEIIKNPKEILISKSKEYEIEILTEKDFSNFNIEIQIIQITSKQKISERKVILRGINDIVERIEK